MEEEQCPISDIDHLGTGLFDVGSRNQRDPVADLPDNQAMVASIVPRGQLLPNVLFVVTDSLPVGVFEPMQIKDLPGHGHGEVPGTRASNCRL